MRMRYFNVDEHDQVIPVAQTRIEKAWLNGHPWDKAGGNCQLRIVQFVCDDKLRPLCGFVLKLDVEDGKITDTSRRRAAHILYEQLPELKLPGDDTPQRTYFPSVQAALAGWPDPDILFPRLANALDMPVKKLPRLYPGGPLEKAAKLGVTVRTFLTGYVDPRAIKRYGFGE